jgi:hypothetical protein
MSGPCEVSSATRTSCRRLSPRPDDVHELLQPSAVCSIVPVDSVVPASSIKQYTCSLSAQSIPTNSTCSHLPRVCVVTTRGITNSLLSDRRSRRVFLSVVVCRAIPGER